MPCECDNHGFCELLQRQMSEARHDECKNKPHYFEMFLKEARTGSYERNKRKRVVEPCIHIGEETGRIACPSCQGTVQVKTFDCAVYGTCTIGKKLDDMACCSGGACPEYSAVAESD